MTYRIATAADTRLYFDWANEPVVRRYSYNPEPIPYAAHVEWFNSRIARPECLMLVFEAPDGSRPVGQVRIEMRSGRPALLGISLDCRFRGKGYSANMIRAATKHFQQLHPGETINAYVVSENTQSVRAFQRAGYVLIAQESVQGRDSHIFSSGRPE